MRCCIAPLPQPKKQGFTAAMHYTMAALLGKNALEKNYGAETTAIYHIGKMNLANLNF
jgi:hypothetical protein